MQNKMVAQERFPYRQRMLEPGEEFEVESEVQAVVLRMSGKARDKDDDKKRTYRRRDMKAEQ